MNVLDALTDGPKTIPQLCQLCQVDNEFEVMREVAELQRIGKVELNNFDRIYREDGSALYLAKYALTEASE